MTDQKISPTPYDDVFRTLLNDCSKLILPVINEVFGEEYTGNETITFFQNEHFLNSQDGTVEKRITDSSFTVIGKTIKRYHLECESTAPGANILIRIFEYDAQIALDQNSEIIDNKIIVSFPHTAILALRSTSSTPDTMKVSIQTPAGETSYDVPIIKVKSYTVEDIFDKNLLFLIPFYLFVYENKFEKIEGDANRLIKLRETYLDIKKRLDQMAETGEIDEFCKKTIMDMSERVLKNLAKRYKKILKGVGNVMRGQVLDYEAKRIRNEGISIGRNEGINIGRNEGINIGRDEGISIGRDEGISIGRNQGIKEFIKMCSEDLKMTPSEIEKKIMKGFQLTKDEAEKYITETLGISLEFL